MTSYQKAMKMVMGWDNDWLCVVWNAIQQGGINDSSMVNDIPTDDWIELVYVEIINRNIL